MSKSKTGMSGVTNSEEMDATKSEDYEARGRIRQMSENCDSLQSGREVLLSKRDNRASHVHRVS